MVNSPDVSVIVPVFNGGDGLEFSLRSLLNQTLKKLEIIVVNDASTDTSKAVIDILASENGNIVAIHLPENQGVHEARLAGIKKAAAPWIGFLDADDFARPNMFEVMLGAGKQENVDIVVCGSYRVTPERKLIAPKLRFKRSKKVDSDVFEKFCRFEFGTGMLWNKLYRREVLTPYGDMHFPWRQNINEDLVLNLGLFKKASSIYLLKEVLHEYVFNKSSVTSNSDNARDFVSTFRAFALALYCVPGLHEDSRHWVIELYRRQLSTQNYCVDDITKLLAYNDDLKEAINLISSIDSGYLAILSARRVPNNLPVNALFSIIKFKIKKWLIGPV
jgi:glycosyltransferase involved in cell wall biosynthesis